MSSLHLTVAVAAASLLSACVTTYDPLPTDSPALSSQNALLASLREDELLDDVLIRIPYPIGSGFDFAGPNHRTTFVAFRNDDTGAHFALVFVDGRLSYVLPHRESSGFFLCRRLTTPIGTHWSEGKQTDLSGWFRSRSVLGQAAALNVQDPGLRRPPESTRQPSAAEDASIAAATLIVYAPFFVVGAPVMVHEAARGKFSREAREEDIRKHKEFEVRGKKRSEGFQTINLGMSQEQVTQAIGESESCRDLPMGRKYLWFGGMGILLRDGNVILKERYVLPYWDMESIDHQRRQDPFWIRKNHFDPEKDCSGFNKPDG